MFLSYPASWINLFSSALDFLLILTAVYFGLRFLRRTRAAPIAIGLIVFVSACWLMLRYVPSRLTPILSGILFYLPVLIIVLFQQEIRQLFMLLGNRLVLRPYRKLGGDIYDEIVLAASTLASTKTGALIVIERGVGLRGLIDAGVEMDATVSYDLLVSIFNPSSPLHDGAVIVRGNRVAAASCFGPLSLNPGLSRNLGSRHRAAIGMTEDSDAIVVVVSEETGLVSLCRNGRLRRGLDATKLRSALDNALEAVEPLAEKAKF